MKTTQNQLVSYIAPAAPATRRPADGGEAFVRPEREEQLCKDFVRIARDDAPCDIVLADIEAGTPDARVRFAIDLCGDLSENQ